MIKALKVILVPMYNFEDIGTNSIAAYLQQHNVDVTLIYLKEQHTDHYKPPSAKELDLFYRLLEREQPDIIGLGLKSCFI